MGDVELGYKKNQCISIQAGLYMVVEHKLYKTYEVALCTQTLELHMSNPLFIKGVDKGNHNGGKMVWLTCIPLNVLLWINVFVWYLVAIVRCDSTWHNHHMQTAEANMSINISLNAQYRDIHKLQLYDGTMV